MTSTPVAEWADAPTAVNPWAAPVLAPGAAPVLAPGVDPVPGRVDAPALTPAVAPGPAGVSRPRLSRPAPARPASAPVARRAPRPRRGRPLAEGLRLTRRDQELLWLLARYGLATTGQLARAFNTSVGALRNRLPRLERAGVIKSGHGFHRTAKVWLVTEAGLATISCSLTEPDLRPATLNHLLGLVDLGIGFEASGEVVLTERELRAASLRNVHPTPRMRAAADLLGVPVSVDGLAIDGTHAAVRAGFFVPCRGKVHGHVPDMVLVRTPFPNGLPGKISIEYEISRKAKTAEGGLVDIITAYRDATNLYDAVYYFVVDGERERALKRVIREVRAEQRVHVVRFEPVERVGDPARRG